MTRRLSQFSYSNNMMLTYHFLETLRKEEICSSQQVKNIYYLYLCDCVRFGEKNPILLLFFKRNTLKKNDIKSFGELLIPKSVCCIRLCIF